MIKGQCIHQRILKALAKSGHGNKILIADGNYPIMTNANESSEKIYLGFAPNLPLVTDVLESILTVINIEKIEVMEPKEGKTPEIFSEFNKIVGDKLLTTYSRQQFYEMANEEGVTLVINTGDTRTYSNIMLTVGVVS
ncbi:RbsD/FucU family protein [Staphylococcus pseudoxylosus]|uniref:RbsD/FucU family protein n=1 Tax=Staphylococcus pseudoxylosus TaxID=2282419 RepID=UPI002DB6AA5E|nr:RbsD/FucU family protein [Staphylococcus pseudoxylosus]MEB8085679.1 RbsD/FucU family protein [Staphylococcus pseudoxylosus]